jgi:hypothetical protein
MNLAKAQRRAADLIIAARRPSFNAALFQDTHPLRRSSRTPGL